MKILYFDLDFPYLIKNDGTPTGGAAVEWKSWIDGFNKHNNKVKILTWIGAKKFIGFESEYEIIEGIDHKGGVKILKWFTHRFFRLYNSVRVIKPDILVKESADAYTGILAIIAKLLKIKFVYRVANDLDTDERYKTKLSYFDRKLYEMGLKFSDHIFCQNKYQYQNLSKKFPMKNINILYNPFIFDEEKVGNISNNKNYIAWVGIFQFQKNLSALLQIATETPHINFKIAGKKDPGGTDKKTLDALEKLMKLDNVEVVGFLKRDEIKDFLRGAYCLLNTSLFEGFSNTFLEAWSVGIPVVTTHNVNPDNIISNQKLGLVAQDYNHIPNILDDLIKNRLFENFHNNCIDYVKINHDPLVLAEKFIKYATKTETKK